MDREQEILLSCLGRGGGGGGRRQGRREREGAGERGERAGERVREVNEDIHATQRHKQEQT